MKYGVLGTGSVAQTIASKLIELGHHVMMGSRTAQNEKAVKIEVLQPLVEQLKDKILIDQSNPYIYQDGHISLKAEYADTTSLGEEIQKMLPDTKVVKTLNYIGSVMMTNPNELSEPVTGFYCGNDTIAKDAGNPS